MIGHVTSSYVLCRLMNINLFVHLFNFFYDGKTIKVKNYWVYYIFPPDLGRLSLSTTLQIIRNGGCEQFGDDLAEMCHVFW